MVQLCYSETPEATNAPTSCGNLFCDCYETWHRACYEFRENHSHFEVFVIGR
jgi:hypothetical protein